MSGYEVKQVVKGSGEKKVSISAPEDADHMSLVRTALEAAGETEASIYGTATKWYPVSKSWAVFLHTS